MYKSAEDVMNELNKLGRDIIREMARLSEREVDYVSMTHLERLRQETRLREVARELYPFETPLRDIITYWREQARTAVDTQERDEAVDIAMACRALRGMVEHPLETDPFWM